MAITTVPVTMRVNTKVLTLAQKRAKSEGVGYQTVFNTVLAKHFGVTLPAIVRGAAKLAKPSKAKTVKAKTAGKLKGKAKSKKVKN